ncbi:MAG: transglycosylase domain-containing protein [Spirochaetota bacterium]|nr:transglycosylase domain-containing protein [Spirochaetota bacterium]
MKIFKKKLLIKDENLKFTNLTVIVVIFFIAVILGGTILAETIENLRNGYDIDSLDDYSSYELPTVVYDINGDKITEFFMFQRKIIPFKNLPENLINALIAMEDNRFYDHKGIDSYSIMRAMIKNIFASIKSFKIKIVEGGSTVTQQLAKLVFTKSERTIWRKIKEAGFALQIEKRYTKNEILEKYFNQIYFAHRIYGVEMASQYFFAKHVNELTLAECAMLIAIIPKPEKYSPFKNSKIARLRQKIVLNKMVQIGFVTEEDARKSFDNFWLMFRERLISKDTKTALEDRKDAAPHFSEYVREFVEKNFAKDLRENEEKIIKQKEPNISNEELEKKIKKRVREHLFNGGFKIYTTLNLKKQALAEKYLREQLENQDKIYHFQTKHIYQVLKKEYIDVLNFIGLSFAESSYYFRIKERKFALQENLEKEIKNLKLISNVFALTKLNRLLEKHKKSHIDEDTSLKTEGALISIDPKTGYIVAMVGGRKYSKNNQLNRVFAKRQPGSAFKAFIYGAAFNSKKFYPASILQDEELKFHDYVRHKDWTPGNADGKYRGPVSLRTALRLSINTIAVKIVSEIGAKEVVDFSKAIFGLDKSSFREDMSIALGTTELSPLDMCSAISVYANEGIRVEPIGVLRIEDRNGNIKKDYEKERNLQNAKPNRVISPQLAYLMTDVLKEVVESGTGAGAVNAAGFRNPSAGKTGTSQGSKNVWFVGYTPNLATTVWIGFDNNSISLGEGQYGGTVAAPVWAKFMRDAHKDLPYKRFRDPGKLVKSTVCKVTGLLQSPACKKVHESVQDIFLENSIPESTCHGYDINKDENKILKDILNEASQNKIFTNKKPIKSTETKSKQKTINTEINKHFEIELEKGSKQKIKTDENKTLIDDVIMINPTKEKKKK